MEVEPELHFVEVMYDGNCGAEVGVDNMETDNCLYEEENAHLNSMRIGCSYCVIGC